MESRIDQDENHPTSPVSGVKSGSVLHIIKANSSVDDNQTSLSQDLDKKRFSEDENNNTPVNLLSIQLGLINNQNENKKASSFVGQGFSDSLPFSQDFNRRAHQSFTSTWN